MVKGLITESCKHECLITIIMVSYLLGIIRMGGLSDF